MIPLAPLLLNRYAAGALGAVAVAVAGYTYRGRLIDLGYDRAQTEFAAAQADRRREQSRETTRLIGVIQGAQDAYNTQTASVAAFRDRARTAERRMREQAAELDARINNASAKSLRDYAQATGANLERLRADVERFGTEAASCSATAHALKAEQGAKSD